MRGIQLNTADSVSGGAGFESAAPIIPYAQLTAQGPAGVAVPLAAARSVLIDNNGSYGLIVTASGDGDDVVFYVDGHSEKSAIFPTIVRKLLIVAAPLVSSNVAASAVSGPSSLFTQNEFFQSPVWYTDTTISAPDASIVAVFASSEPVAFFSSYRPGAGTGVLVNTVLNNLGNGQAALSFSTAGVHELVADFAVTGTGLANGIQLNVDRISSTGNLVNLWTATGSAGNVYTANIGPGLPTQVSLGRDCRVRWNVTSGPFNLAISVHGK